MAIVNGFFFLFTFVLIYQALALPPTLRVEFLGKPILLSDARLVGWLLPDVAITRDAVQLSFLLIAAALYVPQLFVVEFLAQLLAPAVLR